MSRGSAAVVAFLLVLALGCTRERGGVPSPTPPTPLVPQASTSVGMDALISGTLVARRGCLVLRMEPQGRAVLLIWPPGASATWREDRLLVVDRSGAVLAEVGRRAVLGGGFISRSRAEALLGATVLGRCDAGAYWVVSPEAPSP